MRMYSQKTSDSEMDVGQVQPGHAGQDSQHLNTCR